jgi:hypothetical protein
MSSRLHASFASPTGNELPMHPVAETGCSPLSVSGDIRTAILTSIRRQFSSATEPTDLSWLLLHNVLKNISFLKHQWWEMHCVSVEKRAERFSFYRKKRRERTSIRCLTYKGTAIKNTIDCVTQA